MAILAICLSCAAGHIYAQATDKSAYGNLDRDRLAEALSAMGMSELLEALVKEPGPAAGSATQQWLLASVKISEAMEATDPSERERKLQAAVRLLKQMVANAEQPDNRELVKHYRRVLKLAEVMGLFRVEPHAFKLMCLLGGARERRIIAGLSVEAVRLVEKLNADIDSALMEWRIEPVMLVTLVPALENLKQEVEYRSAWIRFYYALALPEGGERKSRLNEAIDGVRKYAEGGEESGVKYLSLLLTGMASRELKYFATAAENLQAAGAERAGPFVLMQASFEIARNLTEHGEFLAKDDKTAAAAKFREAAKAVEDFRDRGAKLLGPAGRMEVDVKTAMLRNHLYKTMAACESDAGKAEKYVLESQKALLEFMEKYPDPGVQAAFLEIIAQKFSGETDHDKIPSIVLLGMASVELAASGRGEKDFETAAREAEKLLRTVLGRKDPDSRQVRPKAMWQLGLLRSRQDRDRDAGTLFLDLSREFPDDPRACDAARNAVISFGTVIAARTRAKRPVGADIRLELAGALEWLLDRWGREKEVVKYHYDLGWQLQKLGEAGEPAERNKRLIKAIAAYQKVPPGLAEYVPARRNALELRVELMLGDAKAASAEPDRAHELIGDLKSFAADVQKAGDGAGSETQRRMMSLETEFDAARVEYEVLGRKGVAMQAIEGLLRKSAGTALQSTIGRYEIGKLIEGGKTGDAIEKVREFRKKFPAESQDLMTAVVEQIRDSIRDLQLGKSTPEKLEQYRSAYLEFARELYQEAQALKLHPDQLYGFKSMYADAMAGEGQVDEGIKLFLECRRYDEDRRKRQAAEIDREFAGKLQTLRSARGNIVRVKALVKEYIKDLKDEYGIDKTDFQPAVKVEVMLKYLWEKEPNEAELQQRLGSLVDAMEDAYRVLAERVKDSLPVDAMNVLGLARAYLARKDYPEALKYYNRLVAGLDPRDAKLYWETQLERSRCILETVGDDKVGLKRFLVLLKQFQLADKFQGGLYASFTELAAEARKRLGQ